MAIRIDGHAVVWSTGPAAPDRASVFGALALLLAGDGQAFAIPSPELVVGSFVSISQLFALASAVLGGGAAYATCGRAGTAARRCRGRFSTPRPALFAVLVVSISVNIYQYVTEANARQERLEATLTRPVPKVAGRARRSAAQGSVVRRAASSSARHQHQQSRKAAGGQGPRRASANVPARYPRAGRDRDGHDVRRPRRCAFRTSRRPASTLPTRPPSCSADDGNRGY